MVKYTVGLSGLVCGNVIGELKQSDCIYDQWYIIHFTSDWVWHFCKKPLKGQMDGTEIVGVQWTHWLESMNEQFTLKVSKYSIVMKRALGEWNGKDKNDMLSTR